MFKLGCWILNKSDRPFSVEIDMSKDVDALKEVIKKKMKPELSHLAAYTLDIWKVHILLVCVNEDI
jgi:Crinkler effector protein N-terminal domain